MGNVFSVRKNDEPQSPSKSKKRTREEFENEDTKNVDSTKNMLDTPKRKKLKSTSKYIYETLFVNGENSDIVIVALEKQWKLHKVYLCQSGYFSSMFSGAWKESSQSVINIDIPDLNIDEEALEVAFGSLYTDDIFIKPIRVISILAAGTLLQLDGLIQQCIVTIKETISIKTVCYYYKASLMYGLPSVSKKCRTWLERNIMTSQSVSLLREISPDLMKQVIASPDLFVMQVEMDIYTMLKKWMFLQISPSWNGSSKQLGIAAEDFLKLSSTLVSLQKDHRELLSVFKGIRYQHVINDHVSAQLLESEKLIPSDWLLPWYKKQWHQMLHVEQGVDKGPTDNISDEEFLNTALRCGRVLQKDGEYCWRWTGYNYGIDLLVTYTNKLIIFKRNTYSQACQSSVSLQSKRNILFRVSVASLNSLGQVSYKKSSGIIRLSLSKDEESVIMNIDRYVTFPLHISVNILYHSPIRTPSDENGEPSNESHEELPVEQNDEILV